MRTNRIAAGLMIVLTAAFAGHAVAAPPKGERPMAVRGLDMIHKALEAVTDLSDEQKKQTSAVLADAEAQLVALRDEAKAKKDGDQAERKAMRQKAQEIVAGARPQVQTSLNDDQKKTFRQAFKAAREEAAAERAEKQKNAKEKKGEKKKGGRV